MYSKWNGLARRTPLKRTPFKAKPKKDNGGAAPRKPLTKSKRTPADELDRVFSLYIRLRDAMPGGRTVCISCGQQFDFEQMQCGHYYARRHIGTRWNELNCHSQCSECNCTKCGNLDWYAINLELKIGAEAMQRLAVLHNEVVKISDDEINKLIVHYKKEVRRLAEEKCINVKV